MNRSTNLPHCIVCLKFSEIFSLENVLHTFNISVVEKNKQDYSNKVTHQTRHFECNKICQCLTPYSCSKIYNISFFLLLFLLLLLSCFRIANGVVNPFYYPISVTRDILIKSLPKFNLSRDVKRLGFGLNMVLSCNHKKSVRAPFHTKCYDLHDTSSR